MSTADAALVQLVDEAVATAFRVAGPWMAPCRAGCMTCCFGLFPITQADAARLHRGRDLLAGREPERAERIGRRADEVMRSLVDCFPGDLATGTVSDEEAVERCHKRFASLPCPVLELETGRCELYEHRPVACRTYGPPLRFQEVDSVEDQQPCPLCFRGASAPDVERCRVDIDPGRLGAAVATPRQTLIAWAVADVRLDTVVADTSG